MSATALLFIEITMQCHDDENYYKEIGERITKKRDARNKKALQIFDIKSKVFKKNLKDYFKIHPQYMPNTRKFKL